MSCLCLDTSGFFSVDGFPESLLFSCLCFGVSGRPSFFCFELQVGPHLLLWSFRPSITLLFGVSGRPSLFCLGVCGRLSPFCFGVSGLDLLSLDLPLFCLLSFGFVSGSLFSFCLGSAVVLSFCLIQSFCSHSV